MKKTLLEITQDVLSASDGDEVNAISDTTESIQVASDIRYNYYDLIGRKDWQFLRLLTELESVGDANRPTHLLIPAHISKMEMLQYNKLKVGDNRNFYDPLRYKFPDEFLEYVNGRDNTLPNYDVITDFNGANITIRNDKHPQFYTSFDDKYIVCDQYDSDIESTLKGDNTQALLFRWPQWTHEDDFIPELPEEMFPLLVAECITYALAKKDGVLLQKTEQTSRRQQNHMSQTHGVVQTGVRYPDYGRVSPKAGSTRRNPLFGPKS